ncbi:outer membrane protein assembly factor BamB family protein [Niastella populi]|uniref:Metallophosphoesterase n=1 Tax=Niastella populi TaxID=550983 RepID=A0A1V9GB75_9BACT|nr:PQQ-binding-like beta-propeller repeat protein [Niastella populi]OQP67718.1 metallophosphoesterase [Niastella populi]
MKRIFLISMLLLATSVLHAQIKSFRFIHISDTHIGSPNGSAEEDLRRTVHDINTLNDVAFVIITGDITELGTDAQLAKAKEILDSLKVKYYIIPGNHDTGWSESGGDHYTSTFGYDKFSFDYNGIRFIGCASGPYVRMSDGHIPRSAIVWLDSLLAKTPRDQPVIFCNHYPIDDGVDNWYEITDRLVKYNTKLIICGHGHANKALNFETIPGIMGRSNLRAKAPLGGYNLVDVYNDSIVYTERRPGGEPLPSWAKIELNKRDFPKKVKRPSYDINKQYPQVKPKWVFSSDANVISTPAVVNNLVIFGNQNGLVTAVSQLDGKKKWTYKTSGAVFSSPAVKAGKVVFGSGDGHVYCLNVLTGKPAWKAKTDASVLGSPAIVGDTVFIGGSDHNFMALNLKNGNAYWKFAGLEGPVVSTPLIYGNMVIFGAWDKHLYAVNRNNGQLAWQWNPGFSVINFSPASCIPVAHDGVVYVVCPNRTLYAIDALTGATLWQNSETRVRESIGISEDGKYVYGKTMQDTVVAYAASRSAQRPAWVMHAGFGYEHVPSMLIEKSGQVFFGTRNGVVYAIDPATQKINWEYKLDNSMVNTVRVLDKKHVVASTMDGKVALLEVK